MDPHIQIQIVTWNSLPYIRFCLDSIKHQTYKNFSTLIIDNASTDGTLEYIKKSTAEVQIIENKNNLGFAAGHNQGIRLQIENPKSKYILVLNPDAVLTPDYLEKLVPVIENEAKVAGITGRILRYELNQQGDIQYTTIIDSEGLEILKSRKFQERNGDLSHNPKSIIDNPVEEVFGISGACAMYRLSALEDGKINGEYFDESFFAYKEDIDMSWRLELLGWKFLFTPSATAYHHRAARAGEREQRSQRVRTLSYKNHFAVVIKNDNATNWVLHAPWIITFELGKFLYLLFREPRTLSGFFQFLRNVPGLLRKRRILMKRRVVSPKNMRRWFI